MLHLEEKMISKIVRLMRRWISDTVWKVGRKFLDYNNSKRLVNNDFTIISRNCVGGGDLSQSRETIFISNNKFVYESKGLY